MQPVEQPGSAGAIANLDFLRNESGPLEYGQMLANGIVIEPHEVGELGDTDRPIGVGNIAKEAMACRIT